jgi:hypothetical protein
MTQRSFKENDATFLKKNSNHTLIHDPRAWLTPDDRSKRPLRKMAQRSWLAHQREPSKKGLVKMRLASGKNSARGSDGLDRCFRLPEAGRARPSNGTLDQKFFLLTVGVDSCDSL